MGKKMDLNGLNDKECARICEVIERDSILRTREQQRLSKIEDELNSEAAKRNILANQKAFNDKYCILCCTAFNFLFNKKIICKVCKFHVCRNCAFFEEKNWICRVCEKQRFLYLQSCKWQCNKDAKNDSNVHFGSAKLFEGFINQSKIYKSGKSDSFHDSIVSSNMNGNNDLSETNVEEKDVERLENCGLNTDSSQVSEDATLIEVREHIEAMIEGFLGESLDSAHVDKPYDDMQYDEFLNNHKEKLSHALLDLTQALYLSMTNKPTINPPTNAHVMLKDLIIKITEDSYDLPHLTKKHTSNDSTEDHLYNFNSYEELLATAIINQLVEVRQSRYSENSNTNQDSGKENLKSTKYSEISVDSDMADCESVYSSNDPTIIVMGTTIDPRHSLVENFINQQQPSYVVQEQIEEITTTKSYSDAEDMPSYKEDSMPYPELNLNANQTSFKVPFPEAGVDIVDINSNQLNDEDLSEDSGIKLIDLQNWEENWLFKKKKRANNKSDIMYGYMALTLAECPVSMLIPNPSQKVNTTVGEKEIDELSELSEHNSVGSLEFSDDESENENENQLYQNENQLFQNGIIINLDSQSTDKVLATKTSETNATKSKLVRNKYNPIIKSPVKVPNFLPIELRTNPQLDSDPHFILRPGDASVQSGIIVQFCCKAKGTKPLLFSWFKNDTQLKSDTNVRIFESGEENILEIKKTQIGDTAQYSCVVYNHNGYQWCDFNFKVRDSSFLSNVNKRTRKQNLAFKSKHEIKGVSPKNTNNLKHDKSPPIVIQRTWFERVAELQNSNSNSKAQDNEEMPSKRGKSDEQSYTQNEITVEIPRSGSGPRSGTIAEREHKKWESPDIEWKDNPYTSEKINTRIQQRALIDSLSNESYPEQEEENDEERKDSSFLSYNSKDLSRYKREYYIPDTYNKEETLRSYDENEYSNSKYFDMNLTKSAQIQSTLREDNNSEINKSSEDILSSVEISSAKFPIETEFNSSDSESILPSVKDLVSKFSANSVQNDETQKLDNGKRDSLSSEDVPDLPKKVSPRLSHLSVIQSNYKVHSLTARSMPREFRENPHLNIPRAQNRATINGNNPTIAQGESEPSSPSTACSPTNEGYASDESNTSSISNNGNLSVAIQQNKTNNGRKFSRSILKRANYWEKRCEQGLISDSSVSEDFPPIEANIED